MVLSPRVEGRVRLVGAPMPLEAGHGPGVGDHGIDTVDPAMVRMDERSDGLVPRRHGQSPSRSP